MDLRECDQTYAFWTTGEFESDALAKLTHEKQQRTTRPIEWKDGKAVRALALRRKLKAIADALQRAFLDASPAQMSFRRYSRRSAVRTDALGGQQPPTQSAVSKGKRLVVLQRSLRVRYGRSSSTRGSDLASKPSAPYLTIC